MPDRLGGRNPGVLLPGWSRPAALGPKAWGEEEPVTQRRNTTTSHTEKKHHNQSQREETYQEEETPEEESHREETYQEEETKNILSSLCFRTFRCHYVLRELYGDN